MRRWKYLSNNWFGNIIRNLLGLGMSRSLQERFIKEQANNIAHARAFGELEKEIKKEADNLEKQGIKVEWKPVSIQFFSISKQNPSLDSKDKNNWVEKENNKENTSQYPSKN